MITRTRILSLATGLLTLASLASSPAPIHAAEWSWANHFGGSFGGLLTHDVHVDPAGNSYVTGLFAGSVDLGAITLGSIGPTDIFIAKVDPQGNVLWANQAGGWGADAGHGIATDADGNVYVTGVFQGSANFGSTDSVNGSGNDNLFLAKYSSAGQLLWVRSAGGNGLDRGYGVAVDSAGNPHITGMFSSTANFGGISLSSPGGSDIFVAAYDPSGSIQWAARAGSSSFGAEAEAGRAIAVNADGQIFVAGHFNGNASFGSHLLSSAGGQDAFVASFDPATHTWNWAVRGGGSGNDLITRLALDPAGNPVVSGVFTGTANFQGTTLTSDWAGGSFNEDFFLARYTTDGQLDWARKNPGTGYFRGDGLSVDPEGNIYVAGSFAGTVTIGEDILSSTGFEDFYVARFDLDGTPDWAIHVPGTSYMIVGGLGTDAVGNLYAGGWFQGAIAFDDLALVHSGGSDSFLAKLQLAPDPIPTDDDLIIDFVIRPGSDVNPISRRANGVLPTAILGSADLDVSSIDLSTVSIWRADGIGGILPPAAHSYEQDNLLMRFNISALVDTLELDGLTRNAIVEIVVSGALLDGTAFEGSDTITIRQ